jgi:hypothetical protein
MKKNTPILILMACFVTGLVTLFFFALSGEEILLLAGSGATLAFALGIVAPVNITEALMDGVRRWHGSIDNQFAAIDNLVTLIVANQPTWVIPAALLADLVARRNQLQALINKCRSQQGSPADREQRNALLKSTVGLCLLQVRVWAYGEYTAEVLSAADVHTLGFLLPGESGGSHERTEATDVVAEVKVRVITADIIRVVVDQSAGENAALVQHGWPHGVRNALIVITADDGTTEVVRQLTTRLHTDIQMPRGSHGKQFLIQASFLKHVNDVPRFGNQPSFTMPLTTADLVAVIDQQHHEDFEEHLRAVEQHRQEVEQLKANV